MMHTFRLFLPSCMALILVCAISSTAQQERLNQDFLDAVQKRDVTRIQTLLSKGADVNAQEHINGHFALQYAIYWPDASLVKLLLDKGANVNAVDKIGGTALMDASRSGGPEHAAIVKLLVERGADIRAGNYAAIFGAVKYADPETVQLLLEKGAPANAREEGGEGDTLLMSAASGGSVKSLQMLLAGGADVKATNKKGQTALMRASTVDHRYRVESRLPMIELLLKSGAEVNAKDKNDKTALLHALVQQMSEAGGVISHPEVVQLLLDNGADVRVKDADGDSVLIEAINAWEGKIETLRLLLAKGVEANAQNKAGMTALMTAADKGKLDVTGLLLEKGVDLNLKDAEGHTALDHAISNGHVDLAKLLRAKGATSKNVYRNDTEIAAAAINFALLRAATYNRRSEIETLLAQGADVNSRNSNGETALLLTTQYGYSEVAEIITKLVSKGADVDATDVNGVTALMAATGRNTREAVKSLLSHKANANLRNKQGKTALHIAAAGLHADIVAALLQSGAEVDARDAEGKTALILAAYTESSVPTEVLSALLGHGAQLNAQDHDGNTALVMAAKSGCISGVEFLLSKGAETNLKNKEGKTPLKYARLLHENKKIYRAEVRQPLIIELLVKAGAKE